ncbi:hypothetical protein EW145_g6398 [Phellinidium pouzarii]|uniref:Sodium/calcium exchanger membrane region domain-containing protein n=1 Tax=Phellinidium pouzarii TaxID=167371 RepID=A0A4S4L1F2_9AGAM|nr:hypothetical protein EW145_g6398 [Phellinidium pouzarii]
MSGLPSPSDRESAGQQSPVTSPPASPVIRLPIHRSTSRSSTWSADVSHHNQGTSYFPAASPTLRRTQTRSLSAARSLGVNSEQDEDEDEDDDQPSATEDRGKGVSTDDLEIPGEQNDQDDDAAHTERDDPLTLKDRQSLMNVDHPFGLPIWKPALYKKSRTVNRDAETALHATPTAYGERLLYPGNIAWAMLFGLWLSAICIFVSAVLFVTPWGGRRYAPLIYGLGWYLLWPFGKYVEGFSGEDSDEDAELSDVESNHTIHPADDDIGEQTTPRIRSPSSTVNQQSPWSPLHQAASRDDDGSTERSPLAHNSPSKSYGTMKQSGNPQLKHSGSNEWLGWATFWLFLVSIVAPLMLCVCLICWFLVITIPMAKLNWALIKHMFQRPHSIRFCAAPPAIVVATPPDPSSSAGQDGTAPHKTAFTLKSARLSAGQVAPSGSPSSTVLLCTYRATGFRYYKYTVGGVNIFFVNLMAVVFFAIADGLILLPIKDEYEKSGRSVPAILNILASRALIFILSLASVIPLSYFIGMAVASISAQSSIGMGAVINATFGSIIEIILYAIALTEGKGHLVEGSIVGSLLAGVLLMPGASMCSGALHKKEQKFNAKSAGVTSTMLIMAIIGTLTPTLFYQTYGNFQLICDGCPKANDVSPLQKAPWTCDHCYYEHPDPVHDDFYQSTVKSLMYFCAAILLFSYLIGLWFSLRTHASQIWQNPQQLMHPLDIPIQPGQGRMTLHHRLTQTGFVLPTHRLNRKASDLTAQVGDDAQLRAQTPGLREQPSSPTATRRASQGPQTHSAVYAPLMESVNHAVKHSGMQPENMPTDDFTRAVAVATVSALRHQQVYSHSPARLRGSALGPGDGLEESNDHGGHEAPSWSRTTSASVLLACTALYAAIAEILVDVVDVVLEGSGIDEKFLGLTLFALVPNTTEFMNAISFAMYGNIALSMEIGSAYALQVCLLQIPAMVAFSAWHNPMKMGTVADTFTLIFPRWDVIAIILSIFLLTYTYIEAKSNYHRGSILILSYIVLLSGFYFAPQRPDSVEQGIFSFGLYVPASIYESVQLAISSLWTR